MSGISVSNALLILWGAVTSVFLVVMVWKSLVGMHEEDVLILGPAEMQRQSEQQQIVARVEHLTHLAKIFGVASLALLVALCGIWVYHGYLAFSGVTTP